jgi:hypothetical protein
VLKPGGQLISISGPPDIAFAKETGSNWFLQQVMRLLNLGIRRNAKRGRVSYLFVVMRANGEQLREITSLIESGIIARSWTVSFPSKRQTTPWLTSRQDARKARSSSR